MCDYMGGNTKMYGNDLKSPKICESEYQLVNIFLLSTIALTTLIASIGMMTCAHTK